MKSIGWTARDFAKLFGTLLVVALAASVAVPTASNTLGISFESDLYRILGFTVAVIAMSTVVMWTVYRRERKSPVVLLLGAVVIAVVIVTSILLFILD